MREYPEVLEHYGLVEENDRLTGPLGQLELLRTRRTLLRVLPEPPAVVYDVGGGTGPYAFWLGTLGYEVHLIDLVPKHVDIAEAHAASGAGSLASAAVGDARNLSVPDGVADVVLLLGPLYHLPSPPDREACWREAARILRPGGTLVAAIISRFASLLDGLNRDLVADPHFRKILEDDLETGVHVNPTDDPVYFTTAYLHRPSEAAAECAQAGFAVQRLVGVEGPGWLLGDLAATMASAERRDRLLDYLERVEGEASMLGVSAHVLVIGQKPESDR